MILTKFRVTEFRSVQDSGWIDVERITALIGTNESGKTNILLPLWKLNPAADGAINLQDDLPRDKYHIYRDAKNKPVFIEAVYELTAEERADLKRISGHGIEDELTVSVSKDYDGNRYIHFQNEKPVEAISMKELIALLSEEVKSLSKISDCSKAETERKDSAITCLNRTIKSISSINDVSKALDIVNNELTTEDAGVKSSDVCSRLKELINKISDFINKQKAPTLIDTSGVKEYIIEHMPKYVYYSNYGNLDSQIYLPRVIEDMDKNNLGVKESAKARTLNTLFNFVNLDPHEIRDLGNEQPGTLTQEQIQAISEKKKEREILLASASSGFTKSFNEWWKQGDYTFEFQADGNFFRIWVSDSIRPERIELESRSTGLQWFFSFYLVFLVESELHHKNAILLLDEPGVTLHPIAQSDLFRFFENLGANNQMIYTTHSPFMVDSNHLERVRSVYIDSEGKTVVSPDLRASEKLKGKNQPQSIYPAHAALGLSVSDTIMLNCKPILVEGESDQLYFSALKNLLISKGRISPLKEIVFVPTGGVKGIKATAAILSGVNEEMPPVIVDSDKPGEKIATELKDGFYAANPDKIITLGSYSSVIGCETEDLFPRDSFSKIVARFLPRPEEVDEEFDDVVESRTPICNQIEEFAKKQGISLERGWKVKLAMLVKKEILKGTDRVIKETDPEFEKILELFNSF